jgi:hypothetical protein
VTVQRDTDAVIADIHGNLLALQADVTIERVGYHTELVAAKIREAGLPGEYADKLLVGE